MVPTSLCSANPPSKASTACAGLTPLTAIWLSRLIPPPSANCRTLPESTPPPFPSASSSADGEIIHRFRRVSIGWKDYRKTDAHYREGAHFEKFTYCGKTFAIGLCGDLWTDSRPEEMHALDADVVLWPVWCDYRADEWNSTIKHEYAEQAQKCGRRVLLINPYCADENAADAAAGGAVDFRDGKIQAELPAGNSGMLMVTV